HLRQLAAALVVDAGVADVADARLALAGHDDGGRRPHALAARLLPGPGVDFAVRLLQDGLDGVGDRLRRQPVPAGRLAAPQRQQRGADGASYHVAGLLAGLVPAQAVRDDDQGRLALALVAGPGQQLGEEAVLVAGAGAADGGDAADLEVGRGEVGRPGG